MMPNDPDMDEDMDASSRSFVAEDSDVPFAILIPLVLGLAPFIA